MLRFAAKKADLADESMDLTNVIEMVVLVECGGFPLVGVSRSIYGSSFMQNLVESKCMYVDIPVRRAELLAVSFHTLYM